MCRQAAEDNRGLNAELAETQQALQTVLHQMKALDDAVSSHKAAAGQAMDDVQRLVAAQQEVAAREQGLRAELAEARAKASLANGRRSLAEDRCLQLADETKQAREQRNEAQAEQVALKVNTQPVLLAQTEGTLCSFAEIRMVDWGYKLQIAGRHPPGDRFCYDRETNSCCHCVVICHFTYCIYGDSGNVRELESHGAVCL